jgi:hypothetical protein
MRFAAFALVLLTAPAALAQTSPAASQFELSKKGMPQPQSPSSPCRDAAGSYAACGYNSRFAVRPPQFGSSTARLANDGQAGDASGAPLGSTARCGDGSFSREVLGKDACAQNGGVTDWLVPH